MMQHHHLECSTTVPLPESQVNPIGTQSKNDMPFTFLMGLNEKLLRFCREAFGQLSVLING